MKQPSETDARQKMAERLQAAGRWLKGTSDYPPIQASGIG